MSAHTPGPWLTRVPDIPITPLAASDRMVLARAFDGSEKSIVDRVRGGTPEQANANAHLIAAAPDLLTAIEESFEYLDETLGWASCQDDPDCGCILHDLHAAVDKARGRG